MRVLLYTLAVHAVLNVVHRDSNSIASALLSNSHRHGQVRGNDDDQTMKKISSSPESFSIVKSAHRVGYRRPANRKPPPDTSSVNRNSNIIKDNSIGSKLIFEVLMEYPNSLEG